MSDCDDLREKIEYLLDAVGNDNARHLNAWALEFISSMEDKLSKSRLDLSDKQVAKIYELYGELT